MPKTSGFITEQITFTSEEVGKNLINLNVGKSSGPDARPIHPCRVLEEITAKTNELLALIHSEEWKLAADVTALFKEGEKNLPENCRHTRLTSVVCKIMERLICHKLEEHPNAIKS